MKSAHKRSSCSILKAIYGKLMVVAVRPYKLLCAGLTRILKKQLSTNHSGENETIKSTRGKAPLRNSHATATIVYLHLPTDIKSILSRLRLFYRSYRIPLGWFSTF